ncbi:MAG TPA: rod shape-determining protein MreC [Acidimicrobiales bacterium]
MTRRSGRSRVTLGLLILASVTAISLDLAGDSDNAVDDLRSGALAAIEPLRDAAEAVFDPVGDVLAAMFERDDLGAENERLRAQLAETSAAALAAADVVRERDALLDLLGLEVVGDIPSVAARVVSAGTGNADVAIEIDRGSDDGVAEGMPVVAAGGLVGRVERTAPQRSIVRLITDGSQSVGVRLVGDGDVALATGNGRGRHLSVELVAPDVEMTIGDLVVTSGLEESVYPPGIPVGTVRSDRLTPSAFERQVTLDPAADLGRLTFVAVLQWDRT